MNSDTNNFLLTYEVGPIGTNCYVINNRFVVDPGGMNEKLKETLTELSDQIEGILLTHTHWDHIQAISDVRDIIPDCRIFCHSKEMEMLSDPSKNYSSMAGEKISFEADAPLEKIQLGFLDVLETPGHSPGGVSFYWEEKQLVLSGDALFKRGVGRTDLPGSDRKTLMNSLEDVLFTLPESTTVYPGHGPSTTIAEEKRNNPFV